MMEYAKDAMETDKPWLRWEFYHRIEKCWKQFEFDHPAWHLEDQYRRKAQTININGHEVPEPYRGEMKKGQLYYMPRIGYDIIYDTKSWGTYLYDAEVMHTGLVHLNKEAAIAHSLALMSFTDI
jgi:hypothetical protein